MWVIRPTVGWGIGVAAHAISVIVEGSILGPDWEERKTREFLRRQRQQP